MTSTPTTSLHQQIDYDSFGDILDVQDGAGTSLGADAMDTLFAFTGREWDADADLYYYRARWYEPTTGRFVSTDPIGAKAQTI